MKPSRSCCWNGCNAVMKLERPDGWRMVMLMGVKKSPPEFGEIEMMMDYLEGSTATFLCPDHVRALGLLASVSKPLGGAKDD